MYTKPTYSWRMLTRHVSRPLIIIVIYTGSIYYAYEHMDVDEIDIPLSISTVLGFAISLLLGFRTNAAYDRWWEARKVWGAIVNDSRTLMRQLMGYADLHEEESRSMANLIIGWTYALKAVLRNQDPIEAIEAFASQDDIKQLQNQNNIPNGLLNLIELRLKQLKNQNSIDVYQMVSLNDTLERLCDSMGKCERIKNTVFPIQYRVFTNAAIVIFMIMLPFGMLESTGIFVIPISAAVMFFFLFMELIAHYLQNPFRNKDSDTPMSAICRTIEINLLQMVGDQKVPEPIEVDRRGVLM